MRRKLLGALGGTVTVAAAASGLIATGRYQRQTRFYRDFKLDLRMAAVRFSTLREVALRDDVPPELARKLINTSDDFQVSDGELFVDVETKPPANQDMTRLDVVVTGMQHALFVLRQRLLADKDNELAAEGVSTIAYAVNGSTLSFTLLLPAEAWQADALLRKLNYVE